MYLILHLVHYLTLLPVRRRTLHQARHLALHQAWHLTLRVWHLILLQINLHYLMLLLLHIHLRQIRPLLLLLTRRWLERSENSVYVTKEISLLRPESDLFFSSYFYM